MGGLWNFITSAIAYFIKNVSIIIEIIEAIVKLAAGIVSLTPSKKDDKLVDWVEDNFESLEGVLEEIAEILKKFKK